MIAKYDKVEVFDSLKEVAAGFVRHFYTEEGLHRPNTMLRTSGGTTAPWYNGTVLFEASDYVPRKGEEWSVLRLDFDSSISNKDSDAVLEACFVCLTKDEDDPYSKFYGWVDSAEIITGAGPNTTVVIRWHLDYYLTYMAGRDSQHQITLGAGRVKRMSWKSEARPDPSQPRRWMQSETSQLSDEVWAILAYVETNSSNKVTGISYLQWQIGVSIWDGEYHQATPSWHDIYAGIVESRLGLDPESIVGFWVSPIPMCAYSADHLKKGGTGQTYAAYLYDSTMTQYPVVKDMGESVGTDDIVKYIFTDPTNAVMFTAPWGITWRYIMMQIDAGTSGANLQIYLADSDEYDGTGNVFAHSTKATEGRFFTFPLPCLPVTANAWASYNYSGQREYDITAKRLQRNESTVNGVSGMVTSAIGGAVAGSMVAPGPGTVAGMAAGLVTSGIGVIAGSVIGEDTDRKAQEAVDRLMASQTAGMIISAGGYNGLASFGHGANIKWFVVKMERDSSSKAELEAEQAELGYICDIWVSSLSPMPSDYDTDGYAWKVEGLEVKGTRSEYGGTICAEGRRYISALFARGVHIDLIQ